MKILKKKWLKIVSIVLAVVLFAGLITSSLSYRKVKSSILGEMGIRHVFEINRICLSQYDYAAEEYLNKSDKRKLFVILSHTKKYDKDKHKPYLLEGTFLLHPSISFRNKASEQGDGIYWEYKEGILQYTYPGNSGKKSGKYYLDKKYAQELRTLFDKYTIVGGID